MCIIKDFNVNDTIPTTPFPFGPLLQGQTADLIIVDDVASATNIPDQRKENTMYDTPRSTKAIAAPVMNFTAPENVEQTQRNYLLRRVDIEYWNKRNLVMGFFYDEDVPRTKSDLLKRLAEGKFTIRENSVSDDDDTLWGSPTEAISWRLTPVDEKAERKAQAAAQDKLQEVTDTINIVSPEEGLKVFREFQTWMPEGVTVN